MAYRYNNFLGSLQKFCNECCQEVILENISRDAAVVDFDAFAEIETFPNTDLVGTAEFSVAKDGGQYIVTAMIGVSTLNDESLSRLNQIVGFIYEKLDVSTKRLNVVDVDTGDTLGLFTVMDGLTVLPVARASNRPLKFIALSLGTDLATP